MEATKVKTAKELARELGLLRKRPIVVGSPRLRAKKQKSDQPFSHLIIIDFESTCWENDKNIPPEIIEFPAVLMSTSTGQIESEFHFYLQPSEHPTLSGFCQQLTGISQAQVDDGIPLSMCLRKFSSWLKRLRDDKGIVCANDKNTSPGELSLPDRQKVAAMVTWSDWDLGCCLLYETRRKQIICPSALDRWIDLRATYRKFYDRKPDGLNGALQDLGLLFDGRQHSGVDDARNTARAAWRMICDGCRLNITKTLKRTANGTVERMTSSLSTQTTGSFNQIQQTRLQPENKSKCKSFEICLDKSVPQASKTIAFTKKNGLKMRDANVIQSSDSKNEKQFTTIKTKSVSKEQSNLSVLQCKNVNKTLTNSQTINVHPSRKLDKCNSDLKPHRPEDLSASKTVSCLLNEFQDCAEKEQLTTDKLVNKSCSILQTEKESFVRPSDNISCNSSHQTFERKSPPLIEKSKQNCVQQIKPTNVTTPTTRFPQKTGPSSFVNNSNISNEMTQSRQPIHKFTPPANVKPIKSAQIANSSKILSNKSAQSPTNVSADASKNSFVTPINQNRSLCHQRSKSEPSRMPNKLTLSGNYDLSCKSTSMNRSMYVMHATPPLCICGRRSKRRLVQKQGPNTGRWFFSCSTVSSNVPQGKPNKQGCKFFQWETPV